MMVLLTRSSLQAHPEFTSKVIRCSPPFLGFVASSAGILGSIMEDLEKKGLTNGNAASTESPCS